MRASKLLEISVETVKAAVAAESAGASRIEFCSELSVGGVTPKSELMRAAREQVGIPIFSMVRPRGGDFLYSAAEFDEMKADIEDAKFLGMDGVVLGILMKDLSIDIERTRELVACARPLPVTFHRAFDECENLELSLEAVIKTGATRILTSGGAPSAAEGAKTLSALVEQARERIVILPGAGINPQNVIQVANTTRAKEFHSGLSSSLPRPYINYEKFESEIRKLVELLAGV
jgi:copper homeostasis protein